MALITAIAGAYTATYQPPAASGASGAGGAAAAQGITGDDGFRLVWSIHKQRIGNDGTDQYGLSHLEGIYRGADWSILYRCREYSVNNMNAAWPYGKVGVVALQPIMGTIARLDSAVGGQLVMTNVTGTPAAGNPATITVPKCIQADGTNYGLEFTSKLREVPIHLQIIPDVLTISASPYDAWFVTT